MAWSIANAAFYAVAFLVVYLIIKKLWDMTAGKKKSEAGNDTKEAVTKKDPFK